MGTQEDAARWESPGWEDLDPLGDADPPDDGYLLDDAGLLDAADVPYDLVPPAASDAVEDPYWARLGRAALLPGLYMPPAVAAPRTPLGRAVVLFLVGIFLTATAAGVCLTYGAPGIPF